MPSIFPTVALPRAYGAAFALLKPSGASPMLKFTAENDKGIGHLQLARPPVNSLSLEMMEETNQWLLWLGSNTETKALVVSSAVPNVFSGGLDITEMQHPTRERFDAFWGALQEMWLLLNTFPKPLIGAITGASPAGGCVIAMGCDYRVMVRDNGKPGKDGKPRPFSIGLNEAALGIVAPPWAVAGYTYLLGQRRAELLLQMGATPTAEEACAYGLVDEVTSDAESCIDHAFKQAEVLLRTPAASRKISKERVRLAMLAPVGTPEARKEDLDVMADVVMNPATQKIVDDYMEALKSRAKK